MDETTKKAIAQMEEALKPSSYLNKVMEELHHSIAKVPDFNFPSISSPDYPIRNLHIPTQEEVNEYQSAAVLMKALADEALQWKKRLPNAYQPAILAILYGGIQIRVQTLSQVSFHGIRIEGSMNGAPCSLLAHQSTIQLLCYAEEVKVDIPRIPIGFLWDDNRVEV